MKQPTFKPTFYPPFKLSERNPLKQGLKPSYSKDKNVGLFLSERNPLKQGLKLQRLKRSERNVFLSERNPLKQGLKRKRGTIRACISGKLSERNPLKQGLKRRCEIRESGRGKSLRKESIKTRIETFRNAVEVRPLVTLRKESIKTRIETFITTYFPI